MTDAENFHFVASLLALGVLLPAWLVFGFLDWWHHRKSSIETTSGIRESFLHLMLIGQAGSAVLAALFLEVNALIIVFAIIMYVAHEITTNIDVGYADPRRAVIASEQRVHDYLTAIPLALLLILVTTHGGQFAALFGFGSETADFSLRWRENPLPTWYLATWLLLSPINALLYLEEFIRCLKVRRAQLSRAQRTPGFYGF